MTTKPLLDFIAQFESRGDYDIVWGGIKAQHRPTKPLTTMTIGEVLAWQDSIDRLYMSEAAGRYQIMEDTLRGLYASSGLSLSDKFSRRNQDRLGEALLRRRGLDDYLSGRMTAEKFCNSLAKEWASLPVVTGPNTGRSYYAGDGLNKAHAPVGEFVKAVSACRTVTGKSGWQIPPDGPATFPPITKPKSQPKPVSAPVAAYAKAGAVVAVVAAILAFLGLR